MRVFLLRVWNILGGWEWDGWIDSLLLCCVWHMCWPRPPRLAGRGLTRTGILEHCILKSTHCTVYQCAVEACVSHWIKKFFFCTQFWPFLFISELCVKKLELFDTNSQLLSFFLSSERQCYTALVVIHKSDLWCSLDSKIMPCSRRTGPDWAWFFSSPPLRRHIPCLLLCSCFETISIV